MSEVVSRVSRSFLEVIREGGPERDACGCRRLDILDCARPIMRQKLELAFDLSYILGEEKGAASGPSFSGSAESAASAPDAAASCSPSRLESLGVEAAQHHSS